MSDFQAAKKVVLDYYAAMETCSPGNVAEVLSGHTSENYYWRGMHPFYEQIGAVAVAEVFWAPFLAALQRVQRRQDIFFAGLNDCDGFKSEWVCSMGHFMGLFDFPWLGIPPTRKMGFLRYAEFHRVDEGKIVETAQFVDILGWMQQAGVDPLPPQTGAALITPGPQTHDGLLFEPCDPTVGRTTLELVNRMAEELTTSDMRSDEAELSNTWHDDMIWFGPAGIGATYTLARYDEQHQGPFSEGLTEMVFNGHVARLAEGNYAGWFGWANLTMKASGGFLGMPTSDTPTEMRVVDIYRRDGDKLAENWIFIDLLHFLHRQGLNVLDRLKTLNTD